MNIDEYRAIKAQEDSQVEQPESNTPPVVETKEETTPPVTDTQTQTTSETTPEPIPSKVTIEGIGEVDVEELKNGYLRQSDYTKKTQELAQKNRQLEKVAQLYEKVQQNPERAQQLAQEFDVPTLDPNVGYVAELENKYHDLLLEKEIGELQVKYADFDPKEVLQMAVDKKVQLEDAYHLVKSTKAPSVPTPSIDVNAIKEQIRQDLLKELELERNTDSIIQSGNGAPPAQDNTPVLSDMELKVARNMRMSPEEYAKWKDK